MYHVLTFFLKQIHQLLSQFLTFKPLMVNNWPLYVLYNVAIPCISVFQYHLLTNQHPGLKVSIYHNQQDILVSIQTYRMAFVYWWLKCMWLINRLLFFIHLFVFSLMCTFQLRKALEFIHPCFIDCKLLKHFTLIKTHYGLRHSTLIML